MKSLLPTLSALLLAFHLASPSLAQELTDEQLIELYDGLRVADVSDGMDVVGLRDVGLVDTRIRALWKESNRTGLMVRG